MSFTIRYDDIYILKRMCPYEFWRSRLRSDIDGIGSILVRYQSELLAVAGIFFLFFISRRRTCGNVFSVGAICTNRTIHSTCCFRHPFSRLWDRCNMNTPSQQYISNPMLKKRRPNGRLSFKMVLPIPRS